MGLINITKEDLRDLIDDQKDFELVDVREQDEWDSCHIKGAKLVPLSLFHLKFKEIDWTKKVVLYCNSGARSAMLAGQLSQQGRDVYNLRGGIADFDIEDEEYIES